MSEVPTLEKISATKVFQGELVKYKFKVKRFKLYKFQRQIRVNSRTLLAVSMLNSTSFFQK